MKKAGRICLVLILSLLFAVSVSADVQSGRKPDYRTDYYMIVESKAGGIDIYAQPDLESSKLNEELIPNGTALHIEGEVEDKNDQRTWGYVEYHGMNGYVPLDDCRPAQSRQEAIDSELYIAGKDNVDYDADYDVTAYAEEGSQKLYQGPGEKYGVVPGSKEIENGEILHITQDAELVDGSRWGVTTVDGKEGWIDLDKTTEGKEEPEQAGISVRKGEAQATAAPDKVLEQSTEPEKTAGAGTMTESKEAEKPEGTSEPRREENSEQSTEPEKTAGAGTMTASKETEKPEGTSEPRGKENSEQSTEPEKTAGAGTMAASKETEKPEGTEEAQDVSGQDVTADTNPAPYQPIICIVLIGIAAVIVLLIYHFRKR